MTSSAGRSIASNIQLWTANDAFPRDPASYELWGTNEATSGDTIPMSSFDWIASGPLELPETRNPNTSAPIGSNSQTLYFDGARAYRSYLVLFPDVKDADSANSMQIAEVQLYAVPEPAGGLALSILVLSLLRRRARPRR